MNTPDMNRHFQIGFSASYYLVDLNDVHTPIAKFALRTEAAAHANRENMPDSVLVLSHDQYCDLVASTIIEDADEEC